MLKGAIMLRILIALVVLSGFAPISALAQRPVDVALILAVDASSSIDYREYGLQVSGLAAAFRDERVQAAIAAGSYGAVAILVVEWASPGPGHQMVTLDWRIIDTPESAHALADEIEQTPRAFDAGGTSIHDGLMFAIGQFSSCPCLPLRQVVDVSGDGRESTGLRVTAARDAALALGITVNSLAILNEEPKLDAYYRDHLIGGPDAFVISAASFEDFARAIAEKLERELSPMAIAMNGITQIATRTR